MSHKEILEEAVQIALEYRDEAEKKWDKFPPYTPSFLGETEDHLIGQAFAANIIAKRIRKLMRKYK